MTVWITSTLSALFQGHLEIHKSENQLHPAHVELTVQKISDSLFCHPRGQNVVKFLSAWWKPLCLFFEGSHWTGLENVAPHWTRCRVSGSDEALCVSHHCQPLLANSILAQWDDQMGFPIVQQLLSPFVRPLTTFGQDWCSGLLVWTVSIRSHNSRLRHTMSPLQTTLTL